MTALTYTCHGCDRYKASAELVAINNWLMCMTCRAELDALNAAARGLTVTEEHTPMDDTRRIYCHHEDGTEHVVYPDADDFDAYGPCDWRPVDDIDNEPPDDWQQDGRRSADGLGRVLVVAAGLVALATAATLLAVAIKVVAGWGA
jgi:hypothetical protein